MFVSFMKMAIDYIYRESHNDDNEREASQFTGTGTASAISDYDMDFLPDKDEFFFGTDPKINNSGGDGVSDGLEVQVGVNPSLASDYMIDSDGYGFSNLREEISGTDHYSSACTPLVLADGNPLLSGDGNLDSDVDLADLFLFSEDFGRVEPY